MNKQWIATTFTMYYATGNSACDFPKMFQCKHFRLFQYNH